MPSISDSDIFVACAKARGRIRIAFTAAESTSFEW